MGMLLLALGAGIAVAQTAPAGAPVLVDRILVIVDEEAILQSDLESAIGSYRMNMAYMKKEITESDDELRERLLDQLIDNKLILAAAKQEGIEITPEQIDAGVQEELDRAVRRFGSLREFERELLRNGMTLDDYRKVMAGQLKDRHYFQTIVNSYIRPRIEVREDEIEAYYLENLDQVPATPDSLFLADILIEIESDQDQLQTVRAKLGEILSRLGAGDDFETVAREMSEGAMASRGGRVGRIRRGDLFSRSLENAIFSMSEGEISQAVVTERGVHIVRLDKIEGDARAFSQIFLKIEITPEDVERAREKAALAYKRITDGEPFALVAGEMSADPGSNANGGDLGVFVLGSLAPEIREALADVPAGGMTEPFQTSAGFYIFLVKDRIDGAKLTLDEIRDRVRQAIEEEKIEEELVTYLEGLRDLFVVDLKE